MRMNEVYDRVTTAAAGSSAWRLVRLLREPVTLVGTPIKLLGKLPVESRKVNSVSGFCSASFLDGSRAIVVGIVRHGAKTS